MPSAAAAAAAAAMLIAGNGGGGGGGGSSHTVTAGDMHGSTGGGSEAGGASLAAAAAAAAAAAPPPVSRHLRAAAEVLGAELVGITALAETCSPRGVLEALALATQEEEGSGGGDTRRSIKEGHHRDGSDVGERGGGGGGVGGKKSFRGEKAAEFRAAAGRVGVIADRLLQVSREEGGSPATTTAAGEGDTAAVTEAAPADGGGDDDDLGLALAAAKLDAELERWEEGDGGQEAGGRGAVEAFRKEFVERVGEAGGLKALALSWNGVAKLDAAFVAWVGEVRCRWGGGRWLHWSWCAVSAGSVRVLCFGRC